MIKIESLNKYYNKGSQNEIHVINNVSLELPESGVIAIYGKSGCGKTTLLNAIGGLDTYASGKIIIDGITLDKDIDVIRNKYIGYIFQNYYLNRNETVYENVANAIKLCGIRDENIIEERVMASLKNVGMDKFKNRYPETLSGGQQQRVAIARAIVKNPRIILADEPTGNLDENNTVMIMNLLKEIGKSHLVLLVTHEDNLVKYYCDKTIGISDGKVVEIKDNIVSEDVNIKKKNDIYLGELDKNELQNDLMSIEYYGEKPNEPIKLKIVNENGNLFIRIDTPEIKVIDEKSEIKFKPGVFKEVKTVKYDESNIDMSKLPRIENGIYGNLYLCKDAIKSGLKKNFIKKKRRSEKSLHACLMLFSIVIVVFFAIFGTSFKQIEDVRDTYDENIFYVYNDAQETNTKLRDADGKEESGISYIQMNYYNQKIYTVSFSIGSFDTADFSVYTTNLQTDAIFLSDMLLDDLKLVEGRKTNLGDNEIVISTKVADKLLENTYLSNITSYKNMLGMICSSNLVENKYVVGVVESDEPVIYLDRLILTELMLKKTGMNVYRASSYGLQVNKGETIYVKIRSNNINNPTIGSEILVNGKTVKVANIIYGNLNYDNWLKAKYKDDYDYAENFLQLKLEEKYTSEEIANDEDSLRKEITEIYYFDYLDFYYKHYEEYMIEEYISSNTFNYWCYFEKGIEEFKYQYMNYKEAYYYAIEYKALYGSYPTFSQAEENHKNKLSNLFTNYSNIYYEEFEKHNDKKVQSDSYFLCDEDFVEYLSLYGVTHQSVLSSTLGKPYMMVYSKDIDKTNSWLEENIVYNETYNFDTIITPDEMYDSYIVNYVQQIRSNIITLVILISIMCVCMYFIMRSQLMSQVKEMGIYRAIGVSKKNYLFKVFIESTVLTLGTVIVGYIFITIFIYITRSMSPALDDILYYPWYSAVISFIILFVTSILSGLIPSFLLLQKTPSQILSKYDI